MGWKPLTIDRGRNSIGTPATGGLLIALVSITGVLFATEALAHVRWFVDPNDPAIQVFQPYALTDLEVLAWIGIAIVLISTSVVIDGRLPTPPIVDSKTRHDVMELVRIFVGMSFLLTAYEGALVAPHLVAFGAFGVFLVFLQAFIGILLISNRFLHHAAILMLILFLGMVIKFGFLIALEYCNIIGLGLFVLINNLPTQELRERFKPYSIAVLRIFTGIALVALGLGEKLLGAALGQTFVASYQWNFMQAMGLEWFTDRLFVLSAGMMEVVFGVILILGTTTRLNMLALSAFMLLSNVVFLWQGRKNEALVELIGHLPLIATALILLFLGYGQRLKFTDLFQPPSNRPPKSKQTPVASPGQSAEPGHA
ncbi:MAG: DoxX family protein [Pseudomonadota bacterium]